MKSEKAAAVLFLCFSIVVAFSNIFIGEYQYSIFIIPFLIALFLKDEKETVCESIGLVVLSAYLIYCQNIYIGIMGMTISSVIIFGAFKKRYIPRAQIVMCAIIIFVATYFSVIERENEIVRAAKNAGIYVICVMAMHSKFLYYLEKRLNTEKHIDEKYLEVLDELTSVARESIDTLKRMNRGKK